MKKLIIPAFAAGILLLAGCHKSSSAKNGDAPVQVTDWGVVEVAPGTPKHLRLEGSKDCTLTATPVDNDCFDVTIIADFDVTDAGVPPGTTTRTMQSMKIRGNNVECLVAHRPVRFTLKLKPS